MIYSDQLIAEKESFLIDDIFKILLGYSERELSQFGMVFNYFLNQFSDSEKEERALWKVDKKQMAREMADHVHTLMQTQNSNPLEASSFHLVRDFFPKNVLKSLDVKKAQKILESYLIALQGSTILKGWLKIKYPSYPLIPSLGFSEWVDGDDVLGKVKSQVAGFNVSKRAKEFLNYLQAVEKKQSKQERLNNDAIKKDASNRGREGGLRLSRLEGVLLAIKGILMGNKSNKSLSAEQIWLKFAQYESRDDSMQIGNSYELYIEGDTLWQNDQKTGQERSIKRTSFDRYVAKVKNPT